MTINYSSKKLVGFVLAFFVVFGIATIASVTAQAQYPGGYGQNQTGRDRSRERNNRHDRYRRDRDRNQDDRYRRDDSYRRNDNYGYDPYGSYGSNNSYELARQQGYSYGMNVGAADAQRGQSYSPQRSRYWKDANQGYNSAYGNKGQYKQVFRDAFAQGYREGYQDYGGYDRRSNNGRWGNGSWPR